MTGLVVDADVDAVDRDMALGGSPCWRELSCHSEREVELR